MFVFSRAVVSVYEFDIRARISTVARGFFLSVFFLFYQPLEPLLLLFHRGFVPLQSGVGSSDPEFEDGD